MKQRKGEQQTIEEECDLPFCNLDLKPQNHRTAVG